MAADYSCGLCRNIRSLKQQSEASSGRSGVRCSGFLLLRGLRLWSGILQWGGFFAAGQHLNGSSVDPVERASRCRW